MTGKKDCQVRRSALPAILSRLFLLRAQLAQRVAPYEAVRRNILVNDRACRYDSMVANRHAWQDGRIGPDHDAAPDLYSTEPVLLNKIFMRQNRRIVADDRVVSDLDPLREEDIDHDHQREGGMLPYLEPQHAAV